jgi:hypothetical protein
VIDTRAQEGRKGGRLLVFSEEWIKGHRDDINGVGRYKMYALRSLKVD